MLYLMLAILSSSMLCRWNVKGVSGASRSSIRRTIIVACTVSVLFMLYKKQRITFAEVGYGMLLGIPNYYSARFLLKALGSIPAFVAYPTFSVATIGVISLAGIFLFREQFTKKQVSAMCIIAVALVLLN